MNDEASRRFKWALIAAFPLSIAAVLLAEACGQIHGSPRCGLLTLVATLFVIPTLVVESALFPEPLSPAALRVLTWVVAYGIVGLLSFVVIWMAQRFTRR
jgi:hypothetical protein